MYGGLSYALSITLLISQLFRTKACKGGGVGERVILHTRYRWGRGGGERVSNVTLRTCRKKQNTEYRIQNTEYRIQNTETYMALRLNDFDLEGGPHQNHYVPRHINNRYINS
jgi:hypothetical protein